MSEVAAFAAWLGASVIVLSVGRRGLATGHAMLTLAFTVLAVAGGNPIAGLALLVGGALAAIQRWRTGRDGWGVMPSGSTPRLLLAIAGGLLALWIATSLMTGAGAPLRFAALSVVGLMGMQVLTGDEPDAALTALAALALSVAIAGGLADTGAAPALYIVAAVIATGVSRLRVEQPNGT